MVPLKKKEPDKGAAAAVDKKRRKPLLATLAAAGFILLADLACLLFYLPSALTRGLLLHLLVICVLALIIFGVGRVISGAVLSERGSAVVPDKGGLSSTAKTIRFILLAAVAVCVEMVLVQRLAPSRGDSMLFNLLFYLAFFGCGVLLARDQDSENAPVLFGLAVALVLAAIQFAMFMSDPASLARFGSERFAVALRAFIVRADALPMEMAITWAAWRVARASMLLSAQSRNH